MQNLKIKRLPKYYVSEQEHEVRSISSLNSGLEFKDSVEKSLYSKDFEKWNSVIHFPNEPLYSFNPKYSNLQNGAINTLENSGSALFIAYNLMKFFFDINVDFLKLKSVMEKKGYRQWYIDELKDLTLTESKLTLETLKLKFKSNKDIQACESMDDFYLNFGYPKGIGISAFFLDNIIKLISNNNNLIIANDTRIKSTNQMLDNLNSGYPIPIRVDNQIYQNDPNLSGGHYIILLGFSYGLAHIFDTNIENKVLIPTERFLKAAIVDPNKIFIWNINPK